MKQIDNEITILKFNENYLPLEYEEFGWVHNNCILTYHDDLYFMHESGYDSELYSYYTLRYKDFEWYTVSKFIEHCKKQKAQFDWCELFIECIQRSGRLTAKTKDIKINT